jgi:thiol-disulfide isomerase/thioredoxin
LEIYLAGRFRPLVTNLVKWDGVMAKSVLLPEQRARAEQIVAAHPAISPGEFAEAEAVVKTHYPVIATMAEMPSGFVGMPWILPVILYGSMLVYVIIPSLLGALLFRGGLAIHLLGIAVVGRDGRPSRMRALRRALIAWLPFLLSPMLVMAWSMAVSANHAVIAVVTLLGLATVLSLSLPRSLQDIVACTWLVPKGAWEDNEPALSGRNRRWRLPLAVAGAAVVVVLVVAAVRFVRRMESLAAKASNGTPASVAGSEVKSCVVVLPNGTGTPSASIWVGTEKNASLSSFRPGEYYPRGMQRVQPYTMGAWNLPAVPDDMPVIVTAPEGLLVTTVAKAREDPRLRLKPFGRVEGTLMSEGKPKPGGSVTATLLTETHELYLSREGTADQDGKFVITNLPPGEYQLYRVFLPRRRRNEPYAVQPSHQRLLTIKDGETVQVQYGGDGRSVTGQAAPENPAIAVDWLNDPQSLELARPSAGGGVKSFISESFGLGKSAADIIQDEREKRSYHIEFEEDGSFRAEDVPPGNYELRIKVTKPRPSVRGGYPQAGEVLGSLTRKVTIPEGKEPFDLGRQVVAVKGEPTGAPGLPMDANLTTVEGQSLRLAGLRGKYVVLVFWASWSEPGRKMLADLRAVREEYARDSKVEFIAASLDDDALSLRQAAASGDSGFTLGRVTVGERASVAEAFDVTTLPATFLLGPDGRILARDMDAERLKATLRRELTKK